MAKDKDANLAAQTDKNNLKATGHEAPLFGEAHRDEKQVGEIEEGKEGVNRPDQKVVEARDAVQARLDKLNELNAEGHEKNMAAIEKAHEKTETVDVDGEQVAAPAPTLGREDNGNTPRVNKDGSKSWGHPSVAGTVAAK